MMLSISKKKSTYKVCEWMECLTGDIALSSVVLDQIFDMSDRTNIQYVQG